MPTCWPERATIGGSLPDALDNPFWASLTTRHGELALRVGDAARFPAHCAPFLGVREDGVDADGALQELLPAAETVWLLGPVPRANPAWELTLSENMAQMACTALPQLAPGPPIVELGSAHRADALALTRLVYPHFFRPGSMDLGQYFGIYRDGRLAAMIGERLGTPEGTELSAICTHPDYRGRGFAHRLTTFLGRRILRDGKLPFLHVSQANTAAMAVYRDLGFFLRAELPFWRLRRKGE